MPASRVLLGVIDAFAFLLICFSFAPKFVLAEFGRSESLSKAADRSPIVLAICATLGVWWLASRYRKELQSICAWALSLQRRADTDNSLTNQEVWAAQKH